MSFWFTLTLLVANMCLRVQEDMCCEKVAVAAYTALTVLCITTFSFLTYRHVAFINIAYTNLQHASIDLSVFAMVRYCLCPIARHGVTCKAPWTVLITDYYDISKFTYFPDII